MYEAYYGFSEKPFALSPDPRYLFLSQTHREVLGHLVYGIEEGEGFMAISGEVGTGKTTLCRTLLERLGSSCEIAFLFNPTLTPTDLIKAINGEFGLSTFGDSRAELIDVLNTFLLERHGDGRRILVIIDEAQNLPTETLEQLRLLGNLESQTEKLLQILLIGQPELDEKLEARDLRQLRQRISVWWRLQALQPAETREYVRHRLRLASGTSRPYFSEAALVRIHKISGGIPRLINVLADRSLLAGYGEDAVQISAETVMAVAQEIRPLRHRRRWTNPGWPNPAWAVGLAAASATAALLLAAWVAFQPEATQSLPELSSLPPVAATPPQTTAMAQPLRPSGALQVDGEALDNLLGAVTPEVARRESLKALLSAWGRFPRVEDEVPQAKLLAILQNEGLIRVELREISAMLLENSPAIIPLVTTAGAPRDTFARRIIGDQVWIEGLVPDQLVKVSLADLQARWAAPLWTVRSSAEAASRPILNDPLLGAQSALLPSERTILGRE